MVQATQATPRKPLTGPKPSPDATPEVPVINTCPFILEALLAEHAVRQKLKPRSLSYNLRKDLSVVHKTSSPTHLADRDYLEPLPIQHQDSELGTGSLAINSDSSSIDGSADPMLGIVDEMIFVHTEAKNWRGTFEAASSEKNEREKRDRLADELMNHLSLYTQKQMVQRV